MFEDTLPSNIIVMLSRFTSLKLVICSQLLHIQKYFQKNLRNQIIAFIFAIK